MPDHPLQSQQDSIVIPVWDTPNVRTSNTGSGLYFEQSFINCYPETYRNLSQYSAPAIAAIKRAGTLANGQFVPTEGAGAGIGKYASGGTTDNLVCLANAVVTQLYDVYVAA